MIRLRDSLVGSNLWLLFFFSIICYFAYIEFPKNKHPTSNNYLINYAHNCCTESSVQNCETGIDIGGFDRCKTFSLRDLDADFQRRNSMILEQKRGAGYWLWKPYIIYHTLRRMKKSDVLMYADSGSYFTASARPLIEMVQDDPRGVLLFGLEQKNQNYTKRDAFILMDCDNQQCWTAYQYMASFSLWRKTNFSMDFAHKWLTQSTDARVLTDQSNEMGRPNLTGFIDHRHDQSVLSILALKETIAAYRNPSEYWGYGHHAHSPYSKIMVHSRWRG